MPRLAFAVGFKPNIWRAYPPCNPAKIISEVQVDNEPFHDSASPLRIHANVTRWRLTDTLSSRRPLGLEDLLLRSDRPNASRLVRVAGFEPAASCPPDRRTLQTVLYPVNIGVTGGIEPSPLGPQPSVQTTTPQPHEYWSTWLELHQRHTVIGRAFYC